MVPNYEYLAWARKLYPFVQFDLASSGLRPVRAEEFPAVQFENDPRIWSRVQATIANYFSLSNEEVTPTLGTSGALYALYAALFQPGETIVVEDPAYEALLCSAQACGLHIQRWARTNEDNFRFNFNTLQEILTPSTKAVVISNLHNPSGVFEEDNVIRDLASLLAKRGIWLIVDEVYRERAAPKTTSRSLGDNILALGSLTKCYGLGWLRAGYVLAPASVRNNLEQVTMAIAGELPYPSAYYTLQAYASLEQFQKRSEQLQAGKRQIIDAWLAKHPQLSWVAPHEHSLFGWVQLAERTLTKEDVERGVEQHQVLVAPGAFFGVPNHFRLGWTLASSLLPEALARLERVLGL
jgi:aspartate/methionine/tyrosine aminotransferase